jgi:putative ABC transport system substrate-binding protein
LKKRGKLQPIARLLEITKGAASSQLARKIADAPEGLRHLSAIGGKAAEAASTSVGITVTPAGMRNAVEIEPALRAFAKEPDGGLIVAPSPFNTTNQALILALASELRLPAIYPFRYFAENGGLASYGFDTIVQHRGAAC